MGKNRKIVKRVYYIIRVKLKSPLCVSSGESHYTDCDVMRNGDGKVFVPGTSIAGCFRSYLGQDKKKDGMMGYSDGDKGRMSSLYVSDLYFEENKKKSEKEKTVFEPIISVRDRVKLTNRKSVDNKFDTEIVEAGAEGYLYVSYILREEKPDEGKPAEKESGYEELLTQVFRAIQNGDIRFGSKKNSGYGRLEITSAKKKEFDTKSSDLKEWIAFQQNIKSDEYYDECKLSLEEKEENAKYLKITVPLKLTGGISIRRYSTKPGQADYEHITREIYVEEMKEGKKKKKLIPIVPGSSWKGAVRKDVESNLQQLVRSVENNNFDMGYFLRKWFGEVGEKSIQSRIVTAESDIEDAVALPMTRNKINRFDGSTIQGALYSEVSYYGGTTSLEIMVKKPDHQENNDEFLAIVSLLQLTIENIQKGYLALGGQVAIGRGIFEENGKATYSENMNQEECAGALYRVIMKGVSA